METEISPRMEYGRYGAAPAGRCGGCRRSRRDHATLSPVAAATTSLPERMGGDPNLDYLYAWLRDLRLTICALWIAACPDESGRLFDWFVDAAGRAGPERVQIMYGVGGERDRSEHTLDHLSGPAS